MSTITFPDGSQKIFEKPISIFDIAKTISSSLAKKTLAGEVNGKLVDSSYLVSSDAKVKIITNNDEKSLEIIRHSTAHLLAQATQILYPNAQVTIGPVIENGFYYDFAYKDGFSENDLAKIEKLMQNIVKQNLKIERIEMSRDEAIKLFQDKGEAYKVEIIKDIPQDEILSFYKQGDFIDLCRGPHVPSTGKLIGFKLMKLAGAYWRGNSDNDMLQRIYGTAWNNKDDLNDYLNKLKEAEKRDHRKIGKTQNLFHLQEESPGMVFWHAKGWTLYKIIEKYLRQIFIDNNYQEIHTPQLIDKSLWEKSGHWDKFGEAMFVTNSENRNYVVKPMNCPAHIQIYNQGLRSYRDLPIRLAEFGNCHRNEPSGTLYGIMRVRNFVQDDGHIFCSESQILQESLDFINLTFDVYKHFGFDRDRVIIKLSTRPEKRVGSDEVWDKAEKALEEALNINNIKWELQEGEGAFYGPKIEFILKDCLDRQWQCGTLQVDFLMPKSLNAKYIDKDNTKKSPVMLHRAIVGSLERFIGILIEHYGGKYPNWLAPVQVIIINISDKHKDFALKLEKNLKKQQIRVIVDLRNEKIGFKIREHSIQHYPYMLVVGDEEVKTNKVSVRKNGKNLGAMDIKEFIKTIKE
jgi:threonyl-tRNA synthetase